MKKTAKIIGVIAILIILWIIYKTYIKKSPETVELKDGIDQDLQADSTGAPTSGPFYRPITQSTEENTETSRTGPGGRTLGQRRQARSAQ